MLLPDRPSPEVRSAHHESQNLDYDFTIEPFSTIPEGTLAIAEPAAATPVGTRATELEPDGTLAVGALAAVTPAATLAELTFPVVLLREAMRAFLVAARLLISDFFCIFGLSLRQILDSCLHFVRAHGVPK